MLRQVLFSGQVNLQKNSVNEEVVVCIFHYFGVHIQQDFMNHVFCKLQKCASQPHIRIHSWLYLTMPFV